MRTTAVVAACLFVMTILSTTSVWAGRHIHRLKHNHHIR